MNSFPIWWIVVAVFGPTQIHAQTEECSNCTSFVQQFFVNFAQDPKFNQPIAGNDNTASLTNGYNFTNYNQVISSSACVTPLSTSAGKTCYSELVDFTIKNISITLTANHTLGGFISALLQEIAFDASTATTCPISNGYSPPELGEIFAVLSTNNPDVKTCLLSILSDVFYLNPFGYLVDENQITWPNFTGQIGFNYCVEEGNISSVNATLFKIDTGNFASTTEHCTANTTPGLQGVCQCLSQFKIFPYLILKYLILTFPCRDFNYFVSPEFLRLLACKLN